jgi:hypothetical protein
MLTQFKTRIRNEILNFLNEGVREPSRVGRLQSYAIFPSILICIILNASLASPQRCLHIRRTYRIPLLKRYCFYDDIEIPLRLSPVGGG